jgi:hypothetical protein
VDDKLAPVVEPAHGGTGATAENEVISDLHVLRN